MSRVLGVDLGEILRASGRLLAVSFTMRRPEREEAPISRAGGVSFYGEHPQPIFDRRCPRRQVKVEKGVKLPSQALIRLRRLAALKGHRIPVAAWPPRSFHDWR